MSDTTKKVVKFSVIYNTVMENGDKLDVLRTKF